MTPTGLRFGGWLLLSEITKKTVASVRDREHLPFDNLFGGPDVTRMVIPFISLTPEHEELEQLLQDIGFSWVDWRAGVAVKRYGKSPDGLTPKDQNIKIGKAISRLKNGKAKWLQWWSDVNGRPVEEGEKYSIVFSRHPIDVVRMSDHDDIESCHSPGKTYFRCAVHESKTGGPIAYMVYAKDLENIDPDELAGGGEIFEDNARDVQGISPLTRLRIRRYKKKLSSGNDPSDNLAVPEVRMYGRFDSPLFLQQVTQWAYDAQQDVLQGQRPRMRDYTLMGGDYRDNEDSELFNNMFQDDEDEGNTTHDDSDQEADQHAQMEAEMQEIQRRWHAKFRYCYSSYEEEDEDLERHLHGEDLPNPASFTWTGGILISFPSQMIEREPTEQEIMGRFMVYDKNQSLFMRLSDKSFYPESVYVADRNGDLTLAFDVEEEEDYNGNPMRGHPDKYDSFCDYLWDNYDEKGAEFKHIVAEWLIDHHHMKPTPLREMEPQVEDSQFEHFKWSEENDGLLAQASAPLDIHPNFLDQGRLYSQRFDIATTDFLDKAIPFLRQDIFARFKDLYHRAETAVKIQKWLPGFEPHARVSMPTPNEEHLKHLNVSIKFDFNGSGQLILAVEFLFTHDMDREATDHTRHLMMIVDQQFYHVVETAKRAVRAWEYQSNQAIHKPVFPLPDQALVHKFDYDPAAKTPTGWVAGRYHRTDTESHPG